MNTNIANELIVSNESARYDACAKKLLSDKNILARILTATVSEFKECTPEEVVELIEGDIEVSERPIYPGMIPDSITGMPTEDKVRNEGVIYYDIRFYAMTPGRNRVKLIINVEAQKSSHPGYDLVTRGIFYCARQLSSQLGTEFENSRYDDIKKVYSIWVCMDSPDKYVDTITEYKMIKQDLAGEYTGKERYDLLSVIMIRLSKKLERNSTEIGRLLSTLLCDTISAEEKKNRLNEDYDIPMSRELEGGINVMCNLSDLVLERGIKQGIEQGIKQGIGQGIEQGIRNLIESLTELEVEQDIIKDKLMSKFNLSEEEAGEYLS